MAYCADEHTSPSLLQRKGHVFEKAFLSTWIFERDFVEMYEVSESAQLLGRWKRNPDFGLIVFDLDVASSGEVVASQIPVELETPALRILLETPPFV